MVSIYPACEEHKVNAALGPSDSQTWVGAWDVCGAQLSKSNRIEYVISSLVPNMFSNECRRFEIFGNTFMKIPNRD